MNSGAAIYVRKAAGSLEEGIDKVKEALDMGLALEKLNQFITISRG
ncbi:MAG: hypothetical protein JJT76_08995 [Clostridiaceae bacterium]|nr:hypothetical protein [Clostridiaceae bacterium]